MLCAGLKVPHIVNSLLNHIGSSGEYNKQRWVASECEPTYSVDYYCDGHLSCVILRDGDGHIVLDGKYQHMHDATQAVENKLDELAELRGD